MKGINMASIQERLVANSKSKLTAILNESKLFGTKDMIPTSVPMVNVALSGRLDGGLTPGLTILAGPSKHFKTAFALLMVKAFLAKYPEGAVLFYDSEFGAPQSYFESFGIDVSKVIHTPIMNVEELKFDIMSQLEQLERNDKVMVVIDSVGNLASKKEVEDALNEKSVADMTRAKAIKSLFRMVTPYLTIKDIPMVVVNHTYMTQEMFSKAVVSGGTGIYYSADNIWIIGRQQDKDGTELMGYNFVINIEKSRYVKEKSKIPISVSFEGGIMKWSGLLDLALEAGVVVKPKNGWYARADGDKNFRRDDVENNGDFWKAIFKETDFAKWIQEHYSLGQRSMIETEVDDEA
jgi:RecA/RadA recombinase